MKCRRGMLVVQCRLVTNRPATGIRLGPMNVAHKFFLLRDLAYTHRGHFQKLFSFAAWSHRVPEKKTDVCPVRFLGPRPGSHWCNCTTLKTVLFPSADAGECTSY